MKKLPFIFFSARGFLTFVFLPTVLMASPASGQIIGGQGYISKHRDWVVERFRNEGQNGCVAWTPKIDTGEAITRQSQTRLSFSQWPEKEEYNVFQIRAPHIFDEEAEARLAVGREEVFFLITQFNTAWIHPSDNKRLMATFLKHPEGHASLLATTQDGAVFRTLYSLKGFGLALEGSARTCHVPEKFRP